MARDVIYKDMKITFYGCRNCGQGIRIHDGIKTLRPGGKFCDPLCMDYVISQKKLQAGEAIDVPNEPGDEIEAIKINFDRLTKEFEQLKKQYDELYNSFCRHTNTQGAHNI